MGRLVFTKMEAGKLQNEMRFLFCRSLCRDEDPVVRKRGNTAERLGQNINRRAKRTASRSARLTTEFISPKCQEICFVMTRVTDGDTIVGGWLSDTSMRTEAAGGGGKRVATKKTSFIRLPAKMMLASAGLEDSPWNRLHLQPAGVIRDWLAIWKSSAPPPRTPLSLG